MIVLIIGHFLTSAKFRDIVKILRKRQIPRLGLKFCGLRKTMGRSHGLTLIQSVISLK